MVSERRYGSLDLEHLAPYPMSGLRLRVGDSPDAEEGDVDEVQILSHRGAFSLTATYSGDSRPVKTEASTETFCDK